MTAITPRSLFLILCVSALPVTAQEAPVTAPSGATAPAEQSKKNRAISGETSSLLSAGYKYSPPKPVEKVMDEDELVDQRDVDKPRNEIIRLPKYMVEGVKPPVFAERNLYTRDNLSRLAMRRYLGKGPLNKFQLGKTGEAYAMQMYWDDERMKNMVEADRQVSLYRAAGDDEKAAKLEKENRAMFLRTNDASSAEMSKAMGQRY
ncbi:hypothetical protein [Nibricoccus aquaticus]|nr:hypothetical protein [Nibricoccus aquaticus]